MVCVVALALCCVPAARTAATASQTSALAATCTAVGTFHQVRALSAVIHAMLVHRLRHVNDEIRLKTWLSEEEVEKRKKLGEQYRCVCSLGQPMDAGAFSMNAQRMCGGMI